MDEWWSITTPDYISANHVPWTVKKKSIKEARISLISNEIYFVSFSFCQNVIIYIIVYANHSLPPEIVKVLSWLVSILAGEGHIMDKLREKNGVHFSDAGTFVFIVSVCYLHLPRLGSTLIWITICTVIWTGDQQLCKRSIYFSSTLCIVILLLYHYSNVHVQAKAYDMRRFSHQSPVSNVSNK